MPQIVGWDVISTTLFSVRCKVNRLSPCIVEIYVLIDECNDRVTIPSLVPILMGSVVSKQRECLPLVYNPNGMWFSGWEGDLSYDRLKWELGGLCSILGILEDWVEHISVLSVLPLTSISSLFDSEFIHFARFFWLTSEK